MKKIIILFGWNVILILLLFLLLEFAIQKFVPEIQLPGTSHTIIADSSYNATHGLRPLSSGTTHGVPVSVDQFGFRKSATNIDTSKTSWLLLGDSVTFGIGVADDSTFSARLQSCLDSVNILNPSTIGFNGNGYWDVFQKLVIEKRYHFKINRLMLFWCLNDVYANVPDFDTPGGKLRFLFADWLRFVRTHSRLYYFLKTIVFDRPKSYYRFDKSFYQNEKREFQNALQIINKINEVCRAQQISFDLILLPYEYQLRTGDFAPQRFLRTALQNEVTLFSPFQSVANPSENSKTFFLYGDGIHLSNLGHRYLAQCLLDYLRRSPFPEMMP